MKYIRTYVHSNKYDKCMIIIYIHTVYYVIFMCSLLFDIVFLEFDCTAAADKLKRQLGALTKLNCDAMMGSLYAEDVITDNEIKIIDDKIGQQKMMYLIVDIIIPSLRLKLCKKYKGFLKAMEESDDSDLRSRPESIMLENLPKMLLGISQKFPLLPYSGLLLRGPKFCKSVKIDPAEIFAIAKFASQSGVGSREL